MPLMGMAPPANAGNGGGAAAGNAGNAAGNADNPGQALLDESVAADAPVVSTQPAQNGDVVDGSGAVVPEAYRAMAAQMSAEAGIAYRYGASAAAYGTAGNNGVPWLAERNNHAFVSDRHGGARACDPGPPVDLCGTWQVGNYQRAPGDYSSNFGHIGFVADNPEAHQGVAGLLMTSATNNTFAQKPELPWTFYGLGMNEVNMTKYKQQGLDANRPVVVARSHGRPSWGVSSIAAFQNGLLAAAGNNTNTNTATAQLDPGKVPTAIAFTNGGEFALVTVWDTVNLRGQVAVVVLGGLRDLAHTQPGENWWGEWNALYPGMPNRNNIAFMKVLGYVDLPAMRAPTEIAVTTAWDPWEGRTRAPGNVNNYVQPHSLSLLNEDVRASFRNGSNVGSIAHAGMAVVVSKSEKKASFIDLRPLLDYYKFSYFENGANHLAMALNDLGPRQDQWPFNFGIEPRQQPTVVHTIGLPDKPTAVQASLWTAKRAFIATEGGAMHIYNMADYLTADTRGTPDSLRKVGEVAVGRNPTHIANVADHHMNTGGSLLMYPSMNEVIVVSRGDRRIDWVRATDPEFNGGSVVRTLRDGRMADPISVIDIDNHGTESYVVAVADYGGKQVLNYRYGPVIFHTGSRERHNVIPTGNIEIEFGGAFAVPGRPFHVTAANIP